MPDLCRVEYLGPTGWVVGHAGTNLLDPAAYAAKLAANGKTARITVLGDRLQPTDEVYYGDDEMDLI